MDSTVSNLLDRAENEILLASSLTKISDSTNEKLKSELDLPKDTTFFSGVISHAYYSIFYSAKAYLLSRNMHFKSKQGEHSQVYHRFRALVIKGFVDIELLRIYDNVKVKAETLLNILINECEKRTKFTYETLPQANKEPAEDSLKNAIEFLIHIRNMVM